MTTPLASYLPGRHLGIVTACAAVMIAPWLTGGEEPLAVVLSLAAGIVGLVLLNGRVEAPGLRRSAVAWMYFGLLGWGALSLPWSVNRFSSMVWLLGLVVAGGAFRLAYGLAQVPQGREWLTRMYLAVAAVFVGYGFWLYIVGSYDRLTGTIYWPNPAAAYLIPAVLICLDRLRKGSVYSVLLVWLGAGFALTDSRGATIVLVLALFLYTAIKRPLLGTWKHLVFIALAMIVATTAIISARGILHTDVKITTPGSRLADVSFAGTQSGRDRLHFLESAAQIWWSSPLQGTGAGTYGDVHPKYQEAVTSASRNAHNIFVQTFAELGIVGGLLLIALIGASGIGLLRSLGRGKGTFVIVLSFGALLVHFALDIDAEYPALLALVGVLGGSAYQPRSTRPARFGLIAPFLLVLAAIPAALWYQADANVIKGRSAQANGDLENAAAWFHQAAASPIANPDWLNAEGIARFSLASGGGPGSAQQAAQAYSLATEASRLDPRDGQHHQLAGRVLALQGKLEPARDELKRALQLDPYNHPDYAYDLSRVQAQLGDNSSSIAVAKRMLEQYPVAVAQSRFTDASLRSPLVGLATLVGNYYLQAQNVEQAKTYAQLAAGYDARDYRTRALQQAIIRAGSAAPAPSSQP